MEAIRKFKVTLDGGGTEPGLDAAGSHEKPPVRITTTPIATRASILDDAKQCVVGDRDQDYGCPEESFSVIASFWGDYLGIALNARDVAAMMCLFKVARIRTGHSKADNWVDLAGYAACGGEIEAAQ